MTMKRIIVAAVAAFLAAQTGYAKCAGTGANMSSAPQWAPAPLSALAFETGGDVGWTAVDVVSNHVGVAAKVLRSGRIGAEGKSWVQTRVRGNGRLSFWMKSSSQLNADELEFDVRTVCRDPAHCQAEKGGACSVLCDQCPTVNGSASDHVKVVSGEWKISGTEEWKRVVVDIIDGVRLRDVYNGEGELVRVETNELEHVFRWTYSKDRAVTRGEDCGWIDEVLWAKDGQTPIAVTFALNGGMLNDSFDLFDKKGKELYECPLYEFGFTYSNRRTYADDSATYRYGSYSTRSYRRSHWDAQRGVTVYDCRFPTNGAVTKAGYAFCGWFTAREGGDLVKETDVVSMTNLVLQARWRRSEGDENVELFDALDLLTHPNRAQRSVFREMTTTNGYAHGWIALESGGLDVGDGDVDVAMSGLVGNGGTSSFETTISNLTGAVQGATGILGFLWKRTSAENCSLNVSVRDRRGIWCDGNVEQDANGVWVRVENPGFGWLASQDGGISQSRTLTEDPNVGPDQWNQFTMPLAAGTSTRVTSSSWINDDGNWVYGYRWTIGDNTYRSTNCHWRTSARRVTVGYADNRPLSAETVNSALPQFALVDRMTWTPVTSVKVILDANGGQVDFSPTDEKSYPPGYRFSLDRAEDAALTNANYIVRPGATFAGWFTEPFGGENVLEDGVSVPLTASNVTYYAHWTVGLAEALGTSGSVDSGLDPCCGDTTHGWFGLVGAPQGARDAACSGRLGNNETAWFQITADGDSFLSFKSLISSGGNGGANVDLFSLWIDGELLSFDLNPETKINVGGIELSMHLRPRDEWDDFYYYLTSGRHDIRWNYTNKDGDDATSGYVDDLVVERADAANLVDWLDKLHVYDTWLTDKLDKFAAAYERNFARGTVDERARARFGHAACTIFALGENARVLEALRDTGVIVEHQPFAVSNFVRYAFGEYAEKDVLAQLKLVKEETPNEHYDKFADEAVAALETAIADLDAIPSDWRGSFAIAATGKRLDESGVACTNDVIVDLADVNLVKANLCGMLSMVQFVGAHDMTLDYDKIETTLTNRPYLARRPKLGDAAALRPWETSPLWVTTSLRALDENFFITDEDREFQRANLLRQFGDGTGWDDVPALPLRSAPYAVTEKSGSVKLAISGGDDVTRFNATRLYLLIESDDPNENYAGQTVVATFVDEITGDPVTITLPLAPGGFVNTFMTYGILGGCTVRSAYGVETLAAASVALSTAENVAQIEIDFDGTYDAKYYPLHWTVFSVEVLNPAVYDHNDNVVVNVQAAPSMTGNADEWKRAKTYQLGPHEELGVRDQTGAVTYGAAAEALQAVRNGNRLYVRLTGLGPAAKGHTFESVRLSVADNGVGNMRLKDKSGTPVTYAPGVFVTDTEQVVFTGDTVEFALSLPELNGIEIDWSLPNDLRLTGLECLCCEADDVVGESLNLMPQYTANNVVNNGIRAHGDLAGEMRWHSVLTHYEDVTAVMAEHPKFLKKLADKGRLAEAKEAMGKALDSFLAAGEKLGTRPNEAAHLCFASPKQADELDRLRSVAADARKALDGPQRVDFKFLGKVFSKLNAEGLACRYVSDVFAFDRFVPEPMTAAMGALRFRFDGDVSIDLGALFENGLSRLFLPQFDDRCWPVIETLPDPTFGGLFPEMTLSKWLGSYLGRGIISLDTYQDVYPHMTTKMPSQLKVSQFVSGSGYVTWVTDLRDAMPEAYVSCSVDGVDQQVTEFAPSHVSSGVWVRGDGEHEIVWTIVSGGLGKEYLAYRNGAYGNNTDVNHPNSYALFWDFSDDGDWWLWRQNNGVLPFREVEFHGVTVLSKRRCGPSASGTVAYPKTDRDSEFLPDGKAATWKATPSAISVFAGWTAAADASQELKDLLAAAGPKALAQPSLKLAVPKGLQVRPTDIVATWKLLDADVPSGQVAVMLVGDETMGKTSGSKLYKLALDKNSGLMQAKVKIGASPDKEHVFAGWYEDSHCSIPTTFVSDKGTATDYRQASQTIVVTTNVCLYARFVLKSPTADPIADLHYETAAYSGRKTSRSADEIWYQGVEMPAEGGLLACESASLPTMDVKGLPSGVKFDKATCRFTGTPTKEGSFDVTVTAKNQSGASASVVLTVTVRPLPRYATGSYDGWQHSADLVTGTFAATVGKTNGKVSGKTESGAVKSSLSAKAYHDVIIPEGGGSPIYRADVVMTTRVASRTVAAMADLYVSEDPETGLGLVVGEVADGTAVCGVQRGWERKDLALPTFASGRSALTVEVEESRKQMVAGTADAETLPSISVSDNVKLKFGVKGTVAATYAFSSAKGTVSTHVLPVRWCGESVLRAQVPVFVKPKKNFGGFAKVYDVLLTCENGKFTKAELVPAE